MFQIHCLNPIAKIGLKDFNDNYVITDVAKEAEGILVRSASMHDMELGSNLLAVARAGAGVNNIPLKDCAEQGIVVFNTPGANANGVKELVLASMLLASRDIVGGIQWAEAAKEDADIAKNTEKEKKNFAGTEIEGKTLGVIGLGAIGVKVANAAIALGMKVVGFDPYVSIQAAWNLDPNVVAVKTVDEIYEVSDFITIHVPALADTKGMIGTEALGKMKETAVILNFARDILCDEVAVLKALEEKKIKKYITDFPNTTVAGHKDCIVIPHLGASTEESEDNCAVMAVSEMKNYLEHGNIVNSVNYPNCDMGVCKAASRLSFLHENSAELVSTITANLSKAGLQVAEMSTKSRAEVAYTMVDLETSITENLLADFESIQGMYKVRVIK